MSNMNLTETATQQEGSNMSTKYQVTRTHQGSANHIKVEGAKVTLCGVKNPHGYITNTSLDKMATCTRCRKTAGLSYSAYQRGTNHFVSHEATTSYYTLDDGTGCIKLDRLATWN